MSSSNVLNFLSAPSFAALLALLLLAGLLGTIAVRTHGRRIEADKDWPIALEVPVVLSLFGSVLNQGAPGATLMIKSMRVLLFTFFLLGIVLVRHFIAALQVHLNEIDLYLLTPAFSPQVALFSARLSSLITVAGGEPPARTYQEILDRGITFIIPGSEHFSIIPYRFSFNDVRENITANGSHQDFFAHARAGTPERELWVKVLSKDRSRLVTEVRSSTHFVRKVFSIPGAMGQVGGGTEGAFHSTFFVGVLISR